MSTFWWEEEYDPNLKEATANKNRIPFDETGAKYLFHEIATESAQLCGLITPTNVALVLGDSGRLHSAINYYRVDTGDRIRSILVESKSGFMALSSDGEILAVGLLKEDSICIFHVPTGDYLASVSGGRKTAYWGQLYFLPNSVNALVEQRVTEMQKSTPKKCCLRLWDLGFRKHPSDDSRLPPVISNGPQPSTVIDTDGDNAGSDDEDDEDGAKLWEHCREGTATFIYNPEDSLIYLNRERANVVEVIRALDGAEIREHATPLPPALRSPKQPAATAVASNGKKGGKPPSSKQAAKKPAASGSASTMTICSESWSTKIVLSKNKRFFAIGHFGRCSVMSCATGELVGEVFSPVADDTYPMVPLAFALDDDSLLICRINFDRVLILRTWRDQSMSYIVRDVGGTISDASAMAPDGLTLLCWPYGSVEMYNTGMMISDMYRKYRVATVWACIRLRALFAQDRALVKKRSPSEPDFTQFERALMKLVVISVPCIFQCILEFL